MLCFIKHLPGVKPSRFFRIFKVFRQLRLRSNRIGKKILRQRARNADCVQKPDGLLVHLKQQVVRLDVSNDMHWEERAR